MPTCPQCGVGIQPTWDWCLGCGFDPEGLKPAGWQPSAAPGPAAGRVAPPPFTPPPFTPPGPLPPPGRGAPAGYGAPTAYGYVPPPKAGPSLTRVLAWIGACVVVLLILPVVTVTMLGRSATTTFESVAPAIDNASTTVQPVVWTAWTAPSGSYAIDFPCTPKTEDLSLKVSAFAAAHQSACEVLDQDVAYFAAEYQVHADAYVADPNELLAKMVEGLASHPEFILISNDPADFAGNPSRAIVATQRVRMNGLEVALRLQGRVLVSGQKVFFIYTGVGPKGTADFERFLASFHIL